MPPGLPNPPQILPRQPGETDYAYRKRRSVELYGETPYQRRIRAAQARGLSLQEARGHRPTEAARRRELSFQRYGVSPYQYWAQNQQQWLIANGWTPETTGWSWNRLTRMAPRIRYLAENTSPSSQVTPGMVRQAVDNENIGVLERNWAYDTFNAKYSATYEYMESRSKSTGSAGWAYRIAEMPAQWWYYHP